MGSELSLVYLESGCKYKCTGGGDGDVFSFILAFVVGARFPQIDPEFNIIMQVTVAW